MSILTNLRDRVDDIAEGLATPLLIGWVAKIAYQRLFNGIVGMLLLPSFFTLAHMELYILNLSVMLSNKKKDTPNKKLELIGSIKHLAKKVISASQKTSDFLSATFTSTLGIYFIFYLKVNLVMMLPQIGIMSIAYMWISSSMGYEAADTIFDLKVLALSMACGILPTILTGHALLAYQISFMAFTSAAFIYANECCDVSDRYNTTSIMMLLILLIEPLVSMSSLIPALQLPKLSNLHLSAVRLLRQGTTLIACGSAFQKPLDTVIGEEREVIPNKSTKQPEHTHRAEIVPT